MKRFLLTVLLFCSVSSVLKAQDTIFLTGDMRHYEDSFVFRWNVKSAMQYLALSQSNLVVEMKSENGNTWQNQAVFAAINPGTWAQSRQEVNDQTIIAAAALSQMRALMENPADDPVLSIQREQDLNFLWMNLSLAADISPSAAYKCHLRYSVKKTSENNGAMFRLYVKTDQFVSDTLYFIHGETIFKPGAIEAPIAYEKENEVELQWLANTTYSAYYVERSGNDGDFKQLNKAAIVIPSKGMAQLFYKDSVANYQAHEYRLYAVDMFGDRSSYSASLKAMGRDRTPPSIPSGLKVTETAKGMLLVTWDEIRNDEGSLGLAIGLRHRDGVAYTSLEKKLLPLGTRSYSIKIDKQETDYFILLQVFDTAANSSVSEAFYQLNDDTPPEAPKIMNAVVDKKGVVTLRWNQNKEKDLQGYLVYSSSHLKAEFSGVVNVPIADTFFRDTLSLKLLNKDIYYRIVAVDYRFNRSKNSETVKVLRPDTLPPVSPNFVAYQSKDTFILLRFNTSSSADVKQNYLCKVQTSNGKKTLVKLQASDTIYRDIGLKEDTEYTYYMYAEDWDGNVSPKSEVLSLKTIKNYYKPAVKLFTVQFDSTNNKVDIEWQYDMKSVRKVVIYKGPTPGEMSKMPDLVKPDSNFYSDTRVKKGEWYYAIKLYFKDGTETLLSIPLGVKIQ